MYLDELHRVLKGLAGVFGFEENPEKVDYSVVPEGRCGILSQHYLHAGYYFGCREHSDGAFEGYSCSQIEDFGGCEGDGDEMWRIFELFKDGELVLYFKLEGVYNSWGSSEWDKTAIIVEAYKVEVTKWKEVVR